MAKKTYPELDSGRKDKFVKSKTAKASINKPVYLIVHHTGGSDSDPLQDSSNYTFKECDAYHKIRFNFKSSLGFYCGYHYYIEKNGKLYQARADGEEGAHTIGKNNLSLGICLAGNFDATLPTTAQITTLKGLLDTKMKQYGISLPNITAHRKWATKTCYGRKLADDWAQKLVGQVDVKSELDAIIKRLTELSKLI